MKNINKYLLCLCIVLFTSCVSMNRNIKSLRQDTWTGRFATMFYSVNAKKTDSIYLKNPTKNELKLLQKDMNFIVTQIRKNERVLVENFNEQPLDGLSVIVENNEFPNMWAICSEKKVKITTGLIRIIFSKAFQMNFSREKILSFSSLTKSNRNTNPDNDLFSFLNILYNGKLKKVKLLSLDLDDEGFNSMGVFADLQQTISFADNELIKILIFLISHEFYHLNTNCVNCDNLNKKIEIDADLYGLLQYSKFNNSDILTETFFEDFAGRSLPQILNSIYSDIVIPGECYLPIDKRVMMLDSTLTNLKGN